MPATVLGGLVAAGAATVVATVGAVTLVLLVGTETVALTVGVDTVVLTAGVDTVALTVGVDTTVVLTGVDTVVLISGDGTETDGKVVEPLTVGRPTARATAGNWPTKYPAIAIAPSATPRFMVALRTNRFAAADSMLVPVANRVPITSEPKPDALQMRDFLAAGYVVGGQVGGAIILRQILLHLTSWSKEHPGGASCWWLQTDASATTGFLAIDTSGC